MQQSFVSIPERPNIPAGELFVQRQGSGRTVLLIHGFPLTGSMWQNQLEDLDLELDLIVPDLRGFGKSSSLPNEWSVAEFARDMVELLKAMNVDEPVICGLSLGGYIAFEIWDQIPDLISGLILCNTRAKADDEATARGRRMMAERVKKEGTQFVKGTMLPRLVAEANSERDLVPDLDSFFENARAESIAITQMVMSERRSFTDKLSQISCPAVIIAGDEDQITPATEMKTMADSISSSSFHNIVQAGHLTPIETPAEFNAVLRKELA